MGRRPLQRVVQPAVPFGRHLARFVAAPVDDPAPFGPPVGGTASVIAVGERVRAHELAAKPSVEPRSEGGHRSLAGGEWGAAAHRWRRGLATYGTRKGSGKVPESGGEARPTRVQIDFLAGSFSVAQHRAEATERGFLKPIDGASSRSPFCCAHPES